MDILSYEKWAVDRLSEGIKCRLLDSMACIPLREDPLCRGCFENDKVLRLKSDLAEAVAWLERLDAIFHHPTNCVDALMAGDIRDFLTRYKAR